MAGGLMQLVAIGAQDIYLTGNPQMTYFKVVYRRHTNFSIESIEQVYNGEADFGKKFAITMGRNGDLLGNITVEVDLGLNLDGLFDDLDKVGEYKYSVKTHDYRGWLVCDGRFIDKNLYPKLFDKIGYSFGQSLINYNLFKLPDLRGRVAAGINDGSGSNFQQVLYSDVNDSLDTFLIPNNLNKWLTGTPIRFLTSGTLPDGLSVGITYFVIRYSSTQIQIATSYQDSFTGNHIDLIDQGTGVHFIYDIFDATPIGLETGENTHSLLIDELPSHNHNLNPNGLHTHSGIADSTGDHTHVYNDAFFAEFTEGNPTTVMGVSGAGVDFDNAYRWRNSDGTYSTNPGDLSTSTNGEHQHNLTIDSSGIHTHYVNMTGNNYKINNLQPTSYIGNMFIYSGDTERITKANEYLKDNLIRWGFQLIDYVEIEIGGQLIDRHYGEWLDIWTQISYSRDKYEQLLTMLNTSLFASEQQPSFFSKVAKVYIPMQFWFNRNPGLYLPLIALQYHEVKLNIIFNTKSVVNTATRLTSNIIDITNFNTSTGTYDKNNYIEKIIDLRIFADYIFLDVEERRRFAQGSHEYLIELVQSSGIINTLNQSIEIPLYFSHPIKTLIWRTQRKDQTFQDNPIGPNYNSKYFLGHLYDFSAIGGNTTDDYSDFKLNPDTIKSVKLQLNSVDRFKERDGTYFRVVQPNQYTSNNSNGLSFYHNSYKRYGGGFYMYNFGINVDDYQPSGSCNFSRIDNAVLYLRMNRYASPINNANTSYNYYFRIYAISYNVLRIMSGMAGLAYSN